MKTRLYHTPTSEFSGPERDGPYCVDGFPQAANGLLPADLVELEIIRVEYPTNLAANERATATETLDLNAKTYTYGWTVETFTPSAQGIWWDKLNGTLVDSVTGIEIAASENVRNILTGQLVMVTTAISVGAITSSTPQDIWDFHGVKHTMPASDLIGLILRHGQAWAAMFAEFAP